MEQIITTLTNNPILFALAFVLNSIIGTLKDIVVEKLDLVKGKGDTPEKGIHQMIFRNILLLLLLGISFVTTWGLCNAGFVSPIDNNTFNTSIVVTILSVIMYEIGVKDIMGYIKGKIGIKSTTDNNGASNDQNK